MPEQNDHELLELAKNGSETAFAALVARHVNLVYSTALRFTGNPHHAEEITQAVFIILARKALSPRTLLSGWLYQTARLTAANFVKGEIRRQNREQEAYMQSTLTEPDPAVWKQIAPFLDEAMGRLGETDRNAILLRFFENKTAQEVGAALKLNEAAAHKRVSRALEKLRKLFRQRGVTLTATVLAGAVAANSVQAAPAGLAVTVTAAVAKGAAVSGSTLTIIKGALKIMAWIKVKTAIIASAVVLLAAGTTTITIKEIQEYRTYPWQVQNLDTQILEKVPPQVRIVPARFPQFGGSGTSGNKTMGLGESVQDILQDAYRQSSERTILLNKMPQGKYDFIANLPSGNEEALQREIKQQFGLVGRREIRETDVLLLKVQSSYAPELKPADSRRLLPNEGSSSSSWRSGNFRSRNKVLPALTGFLESRFAVPVIDRTGLTDHFDIDLKWDETDSQHPNLENLKQALLDQLGLELVPGREPVEMLMVEKVK